MSMNNATIGPEFTDVVTFIPSYSFNKSIDRIIGGLIILCMIVGITGNISASHIYFWKRRVGSFPNRLYLIVCGVDICTSIIAFPVVAVLFNDRLPVLFSNDIVCGTWALTFNFLQRFSMFMVLIVSVTRTIAITMPFYPINKRAALTACGCFGMYLVVLDSVFLGLGKIEFVFWGPPACCGFVNFGNLLTWAIYIGHNLVIVFTISLAVSVSFVLSSTVLLKRNSIQCEAVRKSREVSVTIAFFTAVFLLCNLPSFVIQLIVNCITWFKLDTLGLNFGRSSFVIRYGWLLSHHFFTTLNAALNPCLYHLRMKREG